MSKIAKYLAATTIIIAVVFLNNLEAKNVEIQKPVQCGEYGDIIKMLIEQFGERPIIVTQFESPNNVRPTAIFYNRRTGSFTVLEILEVENTETKETKNLTCIVSSGVFSTFIPENLFNHVV